jgi:hypothetical protein
MTSSHGYRGQSIAFRLKKRGLPYPSITEMYNSKENAMDEYLFITLAQLKADRLKLEREQRAAELPIEAPRPSAKQTTQRPLKTSWFSPAPRWREQS